MDNVNEAEELIRDIRRSKHVDEGGGDDEIACDLERALKIKPTHFILELIQNADDNRYPADTVPHLNIVYRTDGFLWVGCNEIGFTPANVRAICRIGGSTKKVEDSRKGYIGEKGIGFKSVFTVADIVWIRSGALEFRFDKNKRLGMIAPEWCAFNSNTLVDDRTAFCFRIPRQEHRTIVQQDLLDVKPQLLLFLRQLRVIEVRLQDISGKVQTHFHAERTDGDLSGITLTELHLRNRQPRRTHTVYRYIVCRRIATEMPPESRRKGLSESEVLIAFQLDQTNGPLPGNCLTFNYLPIRSYGLPFTLQGDFILSANREDILQNNRWNQALLENTVELLEQSIKLFDQKNVMRYTWPRFLRSHGNADDSALHGFMSGLVKRLRSRAVLRSHDGYLATPKSLMIIPSIFTDGDNPPQPLLNASVRYVSADYEVSDLSILEVRAQLKSSFLNMLQSFMKDFPIKFQLQSNAWHSRMAAAISYAVRDNAQSRQQLQGLDVIPIRHGRWVAAVEGSFFFPGITDGSKIPKGIRVTTIDDSAARDPSRGDLYRTLGAGSLNSAQVYQLILDQHHDYDDRFRVWDVEAAVEQAWFLFRSPTQPRWCNLDEIRVASNDSGSLHVGSKLYMDIPGKDFRVSEYFPPGGNIIRMIHDRYLTYAPESDQEAWVCWLQKKLGIRTLPRLQDSNCDDGPLSEEFRAIINTRPSREWLLLLRDNWAFYEADLSNPRLRDILARTPVHCDMGEGNRALSMSYLRSRSVMAELIHEEAVFKVDVDDPTDPRWLQLSLLRLRTKPDVNLYLKDLKKYATGAAHTLETVKRLYANISKHSQERPDFVRRTFETFNLVYVASPSPGRWLKLGECRWKSPASLPSFVSLRSRYAEFHGLFVTCLGVPNASVCDIVHDLEKLDGDLDQIELIKKIILVLNSFVNDTTDHAAIAELTSKNTKFLPVRTTQLDLRSCADRDWFIADRKKLEDCFRGKVALLDFECGTLSSLSEKLGVQGRVLSTCVTEEMQTVGAPTFHNEFTDYIKSKASFILRLVDWFLREEARDRLLNLQVWYCESLLLKRYVLVNGQKIYGCDEKGFVLLKEHETRIYISSETAGRRTIPPQPLSESLAQLCEIDDNLESLLMTILTTEDVEAIEHALERADVDNDKRQVDSSVESEHLGSNSESEVDESQSTNDTVPTFSGDRDNDSDRVTPENPDETGKLSMLSKGTAQGNFSSLESDRPSKAVANPFSTPCRLLPSERSTPARTSHVRLRDKKARGFSLIDKNNISKAVRILNISDIEIVEGDTSLTGATDPDRTRATIDVERSQGDAELTLSDTNRGIILAANRANATKSDVFNMSKLASALERSFDLDMNGSHFHTTRITSAYHAGSPSASSDMTKSDLYQEIGFGGELFVYKLLKSRFQATDDCWTSKMRSREGLAPFSGAEGQHSDFTVTKTSTVARITDWLVDTAFEASSRSYPEDLTYHLEVKTTMGKCEEPFMMSNSQLNLSRNWHASPSDVYIILRVYNLVTSPNLRVYVDPYGLKLSGKLDFTAQGGYYVQPT